MYELLYMSVSTAEMHDSDLNEILDEARRHNDEAGITGMLLYGNREFIQILEGPKQEVLDLYKRIQADSRHTSAVTIHEGPIHNRAFSGWSMAFKVLEADDLGTLAEGEESFSTEASPINLIKENPNLGKELFLRVRNNLFEGH